MTNQQTVALYHLKVTTSPRCLLVTSVSLCCKHYFCSACALKRLKKTTRCYACTEDTKGVFKMARDLHSRIAAIKARGKERTQAGDDEEDEWKGEHSEQHRHGDECTHRHAVGDSHSEHYISSSDLEEECDGDGRDPKAPAFSTLTRIEGAKPEAVEDCDTSE
uniref:RING-type domain-containing protein n=1 Tax=Mesocestoides corti TaxID=53468 RepID=A0A5K3F6G2_MESCO